MTTGFLSAAQIALIKSIRSRAWNRPFTVQTVTRADATDYYDEPTSTTVETELKGDWTYRDHTERRGTAGGAFDTADLILATDILHSGALLASNVRLKVDDVLYSVVMATPYPDSGEIVVAGKRIQ